MDPTNELNEKKRQQAEGEEVTNSGIPSPSHDPAYAPNPRNESPTGAPFPQAPQESPGVTPARDRADGDAGSMTETNDEIAGEVNTRDAKISK